MPQSRLCLTQVNTSSAGQKFPHFTGHDRLISVHFNLLILIYWYALFIQINITIHLKFCAQCNFFSDCSEAEWR
jgi:hypothetical protein